jgi:UDP:flavonoid glycosyltransferase YjiC (YdhE family)
MKWLIQRRDHKKRYPVEMNMLRTCIAALLLLIIPPVIYVVLVIVASSSTTSISSPWEERFGDFLTGLRWDGTQPLNIVLTTWGSRGDHQPNLALALELARHGHNVTMMGLGMYSHIISKSSSISFVEYEDPYIWEYAAALNLPGGEDLFPYLTAQYVHKSSRGLLAQYLDTARRSNAHIIVGQYLPQCALIHRTVAEILRVPLFYLIHDPVPAPANKLYSNHPFSSHVTDHGRFLNQIYGRIIGLVVGIYNTLPWPVHKLLYSDEGGNIRTLRAEYGLPTAWPFMEALSPMIAGAVPTFVTWPSALWPLAEEHSKIWHITGYFQTTYDTPAQTIDAESTVDRDDVLQWLEDAKRRPVLYFAFGSFAHHDKRVITEILLGTLAATDMDLVTLRTTWEGGVGDERGRDAGEYGGVVVADRVRVVDEADHVQLMPRCAIVVHHGGAGTAAQAIRSGRPSITIPAMRFQSYMGRRLEEAGVGLLLLQRDLIDSWANSSVESSSSSSSSSSTSSLSSSSTSSSSSSSSSSLSSSSSSSSSSSLTTSSLLSKPSTSRRNMLTEAILRLRDKSSTTTASHAEELAHALGMHSRSEGGVGLAADLIEEYMYGLVKEGRVDVGRQYDDDDDDDSADAVKECRETGHVTQSGEL